MKCKICSKEIGDEISNMHINCYLRKESDKVVKSIWNDGLFCRFMALKFPFEEIHQKYIREWKSRFMTGNPLEYMDTETKKAYLQAVKEIVGD